MTILKEHEYQFHNYLLEKNWYAKINNIVVQNTIFIFKKINRKISLVHWLF